MNTSLYRNTQLYIKANLIDLSDLVLMMTTRENMYSVHNVAALALVLLHPRHLPADLKQDVN